MLLQFLVENYASIKKEALLCLEPSNITEHPENIITLNQNSASCLCSIYGANASGKSSLFHAMTTALIIIRHSNLMQINETIPVNPFRFSEESATSPSKFEFTFVAEDGLKYIYGFSADHQKVHEEYLYYYKSSKPSMIFDRTDDEFHFSRAEKKNLEMFVRMNTPNKLFLSTATAWNAACTAIPFKWLTEKIDTYTNDENIQRIALNLYREQKNCVAFTEKLMKQADINISDVKVESKKGTDIQSMPSMPRVVINGQLIQPMEQYEIKISTGHKILDGENEKLFFLPLVEESLGTQQLFFMAPLLQQTLEQGKVLVIDEIDTSLHPFIVKFLVNLFRNKEFNPNGAQLIFTTHETTLLSLDTFRRDQIYFTEKDGDTGETVLYSLDDFSVRKTENIEKGYLLGRYGAIPFLHTEEIV